MFSIGYIFDPPALVCETQFHKKKLKTKLTRGTIHTVVQHNAIHSHFFGLRFLGCGRSVGSAGRCGDDPDGLAELDRLSEVELVQLCTVELA